MNLSVQFQRLPHGEGLPLPDYAHDRDAGLDLRAALRGVFPSTRIPYMLLPHCRVLVPTGFAIALPAALQGEVRGRSGLARLHGIALVQGVGTVDSGYRGEIKVLLINHGSEPFTFDHGDRIAQLVIMPVIRITPQESEFLDVTERGDQGFGSTGVA